MLEALLKLRQVCCDPRLVRLKQAEHVKESAELDLLLFTLPGLIEEGRRVLLFSRFTGMLALIAAAVDERGIPYVMLTGDTRDRATRLQRFQAGEVPLFLISLKAGGVGLNLTAADAVIHISIRALRRYRQQHRQARRPATASRDGFPTPGGTVAAEAFQRDPDRWIR